MPVVKKVEAKKVKVKVLKPLHEEGKKTISVGAEIEMEESKAKTLSSDKVKAVQIIK